jgi:hypothetical protein
MATRLGIELFDGSTRIATFVIPEDTAQNPFCLGRQGQVILPFDGVLPVHAVFVFEDGRLWAASASERTPATIGAHAIPTEWVELDVPCEIRMGRVALRPFVVHERGRAVTLAWPGVPRSRATSAQQSAPTVIVRHLDPPQPAGVVSRIRHDWQRASTAVKLLCATLPIATLLLVIGH